jgi:hypothetical protein
MIHFMYRPLLFALLTAAAALAQTNELNDLAWISGYWSGSMGKAKMMESWTAPAGGKMLSVSSVVSGDRMVAFEFLRIEKRPDGIFYVAQPGGRPPVDFKLTKSTPTLAVFENPTHDHPKIITYKLDAPGKLTATIEGDERGKHVVQDFHFERVAEAVK